MLENINLSQLIIILVTSFFTAFFTSKMQLDKDIKFKQYEIHQELFKKVYFPIYKVLYIDIPSSFYEDDYEGISDGTLMEIFKICEENFLVLDPDLEHFYYNLIDECQNTSCNFEEQGKNCMYDTNGEFIEYIRIRYSYLKEKIFAFNGINGRKWYLYRNRERYSRYIYRIWRPIKYKLRPFKNKIIKFIRY